MSQRKQAGKAITEAIAACWETDCPDEVITLLLRAKVLLLAQLKARDGRAA